jgi:hypothetical protein
MVLLLHEINAQHFSDVIAKNFKQIMWMFYIN